MLETCIVIAKCLPVVFLMGVAMFPVSNVEEALFRTAAGVTASTIIWMKGIRPVYRFGLRLWLRVEHGFDDLCELKTAATTMQTDLSALSEGVEKIDAGLVTVQAHLRQHLVEHGIKP